jgi:hypothetical protein
VALIKVLELTCVTHANYVVPAWVQVQQKVASKPINHKLEVTMFLIEYLGVFRLNILLMKSARVLPLGLLPPRKEMGQVLQSSILDLMRCFYRNTNKA